MSDLVHVILDEPQSGIWNMAVDEALLEESLRSGTTFLRLYRWSEPTVSLGYFQSAAAQADDPRLINLPTVRRLSGGGAILHHHEQTYSCALPPTHPLAQQPSQLYEDIHASIAAWLAEWGISVRPRGHSLDRKLEPFLCFLREAAPDLVLNGHKVLGSAQRRRRGAVLQHGSLLLRTSEFAPDLLGLSEWAPKFPDTTPDWEQAAHRLAQCLGRTACIKEIPDTVRAAAIKLVQEQTPTPR